MASKSNSHSAIPPKCVTEDDLNDWQKDYYYKILNAPTQQRLADPRAPPQATAQCYYNAETQKWVAWPRSTRLKRIKPAPVPSEEHEFLYPAVISTISPRSTSFRRKITLRKDFCVPIASSPLPRSSSSDDEDPDDSSSSDDEEECSECHSENFNMSISNWRMSLSKWRESQVPTWRTMLSNYKWSGRQIEKIQLLGICLDDAIVLLQCWYFGEICDYNFEKIRLTSFVSSHPANLKSMWVFSYTPSDDDDANVKIIDEIKAQIRIQSEILAIYYRHQ